MLKGFCFNELELLPGLFMERANVNKSYLKSLSKQGLLQNYYLEAGVIMPGLQIVENPETAHLYWGWEAPICQLRGHFLGHFLSASSVIYACDNDRELKAKVDDIIDELQKCQNLNGGKWIAPFPEKYFTKLEKNEYIWSPQYVMHKLILGLVHASIYANNQKALVILSNLADWYTQWVLKMQEVNPHAIYSGEEAGMLEVWATLYEITKDKKYLDLANAYANPSIFKKLEDGKDPLTNSHQNASIPFFHGAAKMYQITNDEVWLNRLKLFWKSAVEERGAYCTGGQGAGEFWVPPFMQGQFLADRNQEFCTVYNMVRVADYLYQITADTKYANYIEKNLYNGFLAQQNKNTGLPTYFLPFTSGSKKKWGTKTRDFWCCYGTMVQAQTIYSSLIYYKKEPSTQEKNAISEYVISQYIPSNLKINENGKNIEICQNIDMKYYNDQAFFDENDEGQSSRWKIKINVKADARFTLSLRVPTWLKEKCVININNQKIDYKIEDNYIKITRDWHDDTISLYFAPKLYLDFLPDVPNKAALLEGPIVLCGLCNSEEGVVLSRDDLQKDLIHTQEHLYSTFPWKQSCYRTKNQKKNVDFVPLYEVTDEAYTVYFDAK